MLSNGIGAWVAVAQVILTVFTLVATGFIAWATFGLRRATDVLAEETKTLAKMTARPFVVCALEESGAHPVTCNVTLRNTGNATAFDIKLKVSPALPEFDGSLPDNETLTIYNASHLPPGQALPIKPQLKKYVHGKVFGVTISWATMPAGPLCQPLSYETKLTGAGVTVKGLHDIAGELKIIRQQMPKQ